jgi:arylformamidase
MLVAAVLILAPWAFIGSVCAQQPLTYGASPVQVAAFYEGGPGSPILVWVTGAGWVLNAPGSAGSFASMLQAAGITVLVPQYTAGAPEAAEADIARVVALARSLPDHGPLILGGHSAGAHMAAMAVLRDQVKVDGLLLVSGIYDLPGTVQDGGLAAQLVQRAFGADPSEWWEESPLAYVEGSAPPTWVVHGALDSDVRPMRAATFATRMREAGAPVRWTLLAGAHHVDTPLALLRERDALLTFLQSGILDRVPEPVGSSAGTT